jgi:biopolymer transport protein ExbB/TolQ
MSESSFVILLVIVLVLLGIICIYLLLVSSFIEEQRKGRELWSAILEKQRKMFQEGGKQ